MSTQQQKMECFLIESGLWEGRRRHTHSFRLSPSLFRVWMGQEWQIDELAKAIGVCLRGFSQITAISQDPRLGKGATWQMLGKIMRTGIPKFYHPLQSRYPDQVPLICKVDLIEDEDGWLWVAELDGHNKHGLGYSALAHNLACLCERRGRSYPGLTVTLAGIARKFGEEEITVIYSEQERFYQPELEALAKELARLNLALRVVGETEWDDHQAIPKLILDLPELHHNVALREALASAHTRQEARFIIPPKPCLGSKALLALLRNEREDEELEQILTAYIDPTALEVMRRHLPPTYLVSKRLGMRKVSYEEWGKLASFRPYVLKKVVGSGTKGVFLPGDKQFGAELEKASSSLYLYVLQGVVPTAPRVFNYWDDNGTLQEDEFHCRVTAHVAEGRVADVVVTARQDRLVHGAKDCLQIGVDIR